MKKNRPAYKLTVICDKILKKAMEDIIFEETTAKNFSNLMKDINIISSLKLKTKDQTLPKNQGKKRKRVYLFYKPQSQIITSVPFLHF